MAYRKMKKTTTQGQFEIMVDYLQKHPELMTLMPGASEATHDRRKLWDRLSKMLNDKGPPSRSSTAWRSIWSDYKYNIKRKLCTDVKCTKGKRTDKRHIFSRIEGRVIRMLQLKEKPCKKHYKLNANSVRIDQPKGEVTWCKEYTLDNGETPLIQCKEEPGMSYDDNEESFEICSEFDSGDEKSDLVNDFNATEIDEPLDLDYDKIKEPDNANTMDSDVTLMLKETLQGMQKTQLAILKELKEYGQQKKDTRCLEEQHLQLDREKFEEQKKQNALANKRAALELDLKRKELELHRLKLKGSCTDCVVKTENVEYIVSNF